jgi:hypothetical protein
MRDRSRRQRPRTVIDPLPVVQERHGVAGDHRVGAEHPSVEQLPIRGVVLAEHLDDRQAARVVCPQLAQPGGVGDPFPVGR